MITSARRLAVRLDEFRRLPGGDRSLLLYAIGWIALVRLGLWVLPDGRVRQLIEKDRRAGRVSDGPRATPPRIAWAVSSASRCVPRSGAALPVALTTLRLLRRDGYSAELRFVDETTRSRPAVWVECDGSAVIGDQETKRIQWLEAREARKLIAGPETSLLRFCAKYGLFDHDSEHLAALLSAPVDWSRFRRLMRAHKLLPLVHSVLAEVPGDAVPDEVRSRIEQRYQRDARRAQKRVAELERILQLFQHHGLRVIPFKGPVLAICAYGDVLGRKFGDLDLLVDPMDYAHCEELLVEDGYTPTQRFSWEVALRSREHGIVVDLHRGLAHRMFSIPFDFEGLWRRSMPLQLGASETRRLSSHDRLLFLAVKLMNDWVDGRCELGKIRDLAQLLHVDGELQWESLLEDARRRGGERLVLASLELARLTLDLELPRVVRERIDSLGGVARLARRAAGELFEPDASLDYPERLRLYAGQRERASDRRTVYFELARREFKARALGMWLGRTVDP